MFFRIELVLAVVVAFELAAVKNCRGIFLTEQKKIVLQATVIEHTHKAVRLPHEDGDLQSGVRQDPDHQPLAVEPRCRGLQLLRG